MQLNGSALNVATVNGSSLRVVAVILSAVSAGAGALVRFASKIAEASGAASAYNTASQRLIRAYMALSNAAVALDYAKILSAVFSVIASVSVSRHRFIDRTVTKVISGTATLTRHLYLQRLVESAVSAYHFAGRLLRIAVQATASVTASLLRLVQRVRSVTSTVSASRHRLVDRLVSVQSSVTAFSNWLLLKTFAVTSAVSVSLRRNLFRTLQANVAATTSKTFARVRRFVATAQGSAATALLAIVTRAAELFNTLEIAIFAARQRTALMPAILRAAALTQKTRIARMAIKIRSAIARTRN